MPLHASQLYARNVSELLKLLVKDGELVLDEDDQVIREMDPHAWRRGRARAQPARS